MCCTCAGDEYVHVVMYSVCMCMCVCVCVCVSLARDLYAFVT
jgi:hypothetical protein